MRKLTEKVIKAGALTWLVVHFTLTILFVMPANPVKLAIEPQINATIGTFFAQNWSLFAPNPVDSDQALLVRCLTQTEADAITQQGIPTDDWHDMSTPLWARFQQNRFSAYDRHAGDDDCDPLHLGGFPRVPLDVRRTPGRSPRGRP